MCAEALLLLRYLSDEDALLACRSARSDADLALAEQLGLLNKLFVDLDEAKGPARGLLVGVTKAVRRLCAAARGLEIEASRYNKTLKEHQALLVEGGHRSLQALLDAHRTAMASLGEELAECEAQAERREEEVRVRSTFYLSMLSLHAQLSTMLYLSMLNSPYSALHAHLSMHISPRSPQPPRSTHNKSSSARTHTRSPLAQPPVPSSLTARSTPARRSAA